MFVFLMLLLLIRSSGYTASESNLFNGTTQGSDKASSGNHKVCFGFVCLILNFDRFSSNNCWV